MTGSRRWSDLLTGGSGSDAPGGDGDDGLGGGQATFSPAASATIPAWRFRRDTKGGLGDDTLKAPLTAT